MADHPDITVHIHLLVNFNILLHPGFFEQQMLFV